MDQPQSSLSIREATSDLSSLARGGTLSLLGGAGGAALSLALIFVLTLGVGAADAGGFFEAIALFNIAAVASTLGVDTGLLRFTARNLALTGRTALPALLRIALGPLLAASSAVAVAGYSNAAPIARVIGDPDHAAEIATYLRVLAVLVPVGALTLALMGATRGFGTMLPTVVGERIGKPAVQLALVGMSVALAAGAGWLAVSWGAGVVTSLVVAALWLYILQRRHAARREHIAPDETPGESVFRHFWGFTLPRALASIFRVGVLWLDVVLVGALISPTAAAVYTVATRLLQAGFLAVDAIGQAVEPMFSSLLAAEQVDRARQLFQVATGWLVGLTWPYFLTLWIFAPAVLGLFGEEFAAGASVVAILAGSALVGSGFGPVDVLLVMAGKSTWSFWNSAVSLTLNVVLNLVLIPQFGLPGAAIAWAMSRLTANILPLLQVRRLLGFHPFGSAWQIAAALSLVTFGALGLAVRLGFGAAVPSAMLAVVLGLATYGVTVWRWRNRLDLAAFRSLLAPTGRTARRR